MKLMLEEMETHFNVSADNRGIFHVHSDDPVWQKRLEGIGLEAIKVSADGTSKEYLLPANQLKLRKPMSKEERARRSAALAAYRDKNKA